MIRRKKTSCFGGFCSGFPVKFTLKSLKITEILITRRAEFHGFTRG
jgi:hypothetical protein